MKNLLVLITLLFCSLANACDSHKEIKIKDSWVRATMGGSHMTAAYMNIKNDSDDADVLYKVTSKQAGKIELHKIVDEKSPNLFSPNFFLRIFFGSKKDRSN